MEIRTSALPPLRTSAFVDLRQCGYLCPQSANPAGRRGLWYCRNSDCASSPRRKTLRQRHMDVGRIDSRNRANQFTHHVDM